MGEPTFSAKQVSAALRVPHGTLNGWAHDGLFRGLDAEVTRPGKRRKFSLKDLVRLGILKQLLDLGVKAENARQWASRCVNHMDEHGRHVTEMNILFYPDYEVIRLNDDLMEQPTEPGWLLRLTISPVDIVSSLKANLARAASDARHAQQTREEESLATVQVWNTTTKREEDA